jgi:nucleoside-diphosphate-sugar epimerase
VSARTVLITGANGYLGSRLARALLERTDDRLLLWVHAGDAATLARKRAGLERELGPPPGAAPARVRIAGGDLTAPEPFAGLEREPVTHVVHAAAVTRFNVERELAQAVNVEGTRKLLALARLLPELRSLDFLSTVYSSGLRPGRIPEQPLDDSCGFANHYEWSKWQAEELVRAHSPVPARIQRVCTLIADERSGAVSQQNAFHNTLKLLFYGLLSLVPGEPGTPLYFVTAEYAAAAALALLARAPESAVFHVSPARVGAIELGALIELAFACFQQQEDFRRRRVLAPLFTELESFELLSSGVQGGAGGSVVNQALQSVAPFARQMFVRKDVANERLVSALGGHEPDDSTALIRAVCQQLVRTRWGRKTIEEHVRAPAT